MDRNLEKIAQKRVAYVCTSTHCTHRIQNVIYMTILCIYKFAMKHNQKV